MSELNDRIDNPLGKPRNRREDGSLPPSKTPIADRPHLGSHPEKTGKPPQEPSELDLIPPPIRIDDIDLDANDELPKNAVFGTPVDVPESTLIYRKNPDDPDAPPVLIGPINKLQHARTLEWTDEDPLKQNRDLEVSAPILDEENKTVLRRVQFVVKPDGKGGLVSAPKQTK